MKKTKSVSFRLLLAFSVIGFSITFNLSHAAILSWSGAGGANANWNNSANWGFVGIPASGDTLIFSAAQPDLVNTNNIAGLTLNQIRFVGAGGGYDIRGLAFTLTNHIEATNSAGANTIENSITLATQDQIIDVTSALTLSGALSGSVGAVKDGAGTLTYQGTGNNTYARTTMVIAGTLQLFKIGGGVIAIPNDLVISGTVRHLAGFEIADTSDVTVNSGGVLDLNGSGDTIGNSLTLNGNASITTGGGTLTLSPNATVNANPGPIFANCSISGNLNISSGICTFIVNPDPFLSGSLLVPASVSGSATITKTGLGFMSFSAANSFSSQVNIANGTLSVGNPLALGSTGAGTTVSNSATLWIAGVSVTNEPLTIASTGTGLENASGAQTWVGNILLAAATTFSIDGASLDIQGLLTGSGGFTKTQAGTLTLSGSGENSYTGATVVNTGILQLNQSSGHSIGGSSSLTVGDDVGGTDVDIVRYINGNGNQISSGIPITIKSSGLLDLNGHSDDIGPITFSGGGDASSGAGILELQVGGISVINSSNTATISGNMQLHVGTVISVVEGSEFYTLTIPAKISDYSGAAGFSIVCTNDLGTFVRLTGSNSFTGPLTIDGLTVSAETPWALGTTNGATTVTNGGELFLYSTDITNETVILADGSTLTAQYDCSWRGPVILNGSSTIHGFTTPGLFDITGPISGTGNLTSTAGATNRFSGSQANTYVGTTTVGSGTLVLNKTVGVGAIPANLVISGSSAVRLANSEQINDSSDVLINSGSLFDTGVFRELIDTLRGRGTVNFGVNGWIEVGLNNGSSTFDGVMTGTGYTFGGYTVAKKGAGTFTMNGNNTFTAGATHVFSPGTLIINGSQPQVPAIVDSGSTLGGSGTVSTIAASGIIAPGNSPGILTSSNVTFTSSGSFHVELTGPNPGTDYDQLNVRGTNILANASLGIGLAFTTTVAVGQQFTIINNDGVEAINGIFAGYPEGSSWIQSGFKVSLSYVGGTGNDVVLTLTDVPGAVVGTAVSSGNGDGAISPNECNYLSIVISNKTGTTMTNISATLASATANVAITQPFATYSDAPGNGTATNLGPFQITTSPDFVCGTDINLRLQVVSSTHGAFTVPVVIHSGSPSAAPGRYDNNIVTNVPDIGTIESTNSVASWSGGPLAKIQVSLWLVAPFSSDVALSLISPDGTTVLLSSGNGAGANFGSGSGDSSRTTFDDAAATSITAGASPFVGTFRPQASLAGLLASDPVGKWRLRIQDAFGSGSPDTLRAWSLFLYGTECAPGSGVCELCPDITIFGALDGSSLVASDRLTRDGVVSTCGTPKTCPGPFGGDSPFYDAYTFRNGPSNACITVTLTATPTADLFSAAYLGSFSPTDNCFNYLADAGDSTDFSSASSSYSFNVASGAVFVVEVNSIFGSIGSYQLTVTGGDCRPALNITDVGAGKALLDWTTAAAGYVLERTNNLAAGPVWQPVPGEPAVINSRFTVTNNILPANQFYRLRKPLP